MTNDIRYLLQGLLHPAGLEQINLTLYFCCLFVHFLCLVCFLIISLRKQSVEPSSRPKPTWAAPWGPYRTSVSMPMCHTMEIALLFFDVRSSPSDSGSTGYSVLWLFFHHITLLLLWEEPHTGGIDRQRYWLTHGHNNKTRLQWGHVKIWFLGLPERKIKIGK